MRYRYAIPLLRLTSPRDSHTATRLAFMVGDQGRDTPSPAQEARLLKGLAGSRHVRETTDSSKIPAFVTEMFRDVDDPRRRYRTGAAT
jgi:hypothetical protein